MTLRRAAPHLRRAAAAPPLVGGRATAFVCRDYTCRQPVTGEAELEALLVAETSAGREG